MTNLTIETKKRKIKFTEKANRNILIIGSLFFIAIFFMSFFMTKYFHSKMGEVNANELTPNNEITKNISKDKANGDSSKIVRPDVSKLEVKVEDVFKHDGKKTAFLTFDDGPTSTITPKILNILKEHNIKATFFVVGNQIGYNTDILKEVYKEGHAIGNHSYSHDYKNVYLSKFRFEQEVDKTAIALKQALGQDFSTRLFRFPGGSFGKHKSKYRELIAEKNYVHIDWNALNGDAETTKKRTSTELFARFKNTVRNQEDLVVLMHDSLGKEATVEALPEIIKFLQEKGYEFKILK